MKSVAQALAASFAAQGVKRIFGVPGGGSSLDIIEAAAAEDIEFVLTRTESGAVMMAAATAELEHTLGVALTTKGPGTANATNGVAYASLDRAPVLLLTDGFNPKEQGYVTHQVFDQKTLLTPITKGHSRLDSDSVADEIHSLIELALTPPFGPVLVELTGSRAAADAGDDAHIFSGVEVISGVDETGLTQAKQLLDKATRPVLIVGLEARHDQAAEAIQAFAENLGCPVLSTYKAKGVVSDLHRQSVGLFTSGNAEAETVEQADLIVLVGLDPVELLRQPWRYQAPVIDIAWRAHSVHYVTPAAGVYGDLVTHVRQLDNDIKKSAWQPAEIDELRQRMLARLSYPDSDGVSPQQVVEIAADAAQSLSATPRITVDAGAHMFSAMAFWSCTRPNDVLISNGLASMAFALPAAIAAALHEPERGAIAFTGDGGLLMCLGELSVAVQQQLPMVVIVFNDESLSLIDIKQQQRGLPARGVRWKRPDFAKVMTGLGGRGYRAATTAEYRQAVTEALQGNEPALIDVVIDPSGYTAQMKALRG